MTSVAFVGWRTPRPTEEQAGRLAEAVEDMPLLLDQPAAWLDQNPTVSPDTYIRDILMERAVGRDHPWAIGCAKNGVAALAAAGDTEEAAALGLRTAERAARVLGDQHILTVSLRAGLALDLAALDRQEEADTLHQDVLTRLGALLGADHPHTCQILERRRPYWDFEPQPI
ncbi:tetratricopeptide repeat protein [Streptomyces sp. NPDC002920]